ncbi:copper chaperone PCu(A)C [Mycolicibacterium sp. XJ1819]
MSINRFHKSSVLVAAIAACAVTGAGCSSTADHEEGSMASTVTITDQWANSAEEGMAAVFGTFANTGHHDARIVSGTSPLADRVEVHEVVTGTTGDKTMQTKEGGLTVPAGGTHELVPGGDHLMLMDLRQPLHPGADVEVTVQFEDGSTLPVVAQIRDFAGGGEEYSGGASHHDHG